MVCSPAWCLSGRNEFPGIAHRRGRDLPWIQIAILIAHTPVATTTATLFLFQIAMLIILMSACFGSPEYLRGVNEDVHAKDDQKRRGGHGHTARDLNREEEKILDDKYSFLGDKVKLVLTIAK
jgi:hypothetical protein